MESFPPPKTLLRRIISGPRLLLLKFDAGPILQSFPSWKLLLHNLLDIFLGLCSKTPVPKRVWNTRQDRPKICVGYQSLKSKRKLGNENFLSFFIFIYFCFILFWLCYPKGIFFTQCDSASLWTCDYFVLTNQDLAPMLSGVAKLLKFAWHRGCNSNDRDCCYCCCCCCCGSCLHDCCYDT